MKHPFCVIIKSSQKKPLQLFLSSKEVLAFNIIYPDFTRLKGHSIKHFITTSYSSVHTVMSIEDQAFSRLEHLSRSEALMGCHFVNISPDMLFGRQLALVSPIFLQLDDGSYLVLDVHPVIESPFQLAGKDTIPEDPYHFSDGPNVDADRLFSPALNKIITDIHVDPLSDEECTMSIFLEGNIRLEILSNQSFLYIDCCDNKGEICELPFSQLRKILWLSPEDQEMVKDQIPYVSVGWFSEDRCSISTVSFKIGDLAYHSDHIDIAGIRGYIDSCGDMIIKPQYIYANEFQDGIAIVAKGKWVKVREDNGRPKYWTENELWGGIDYSGDEVIPFIFDEIESFVDTTDYFIAHAGGWPDGAYGVIDRTGKWIVDPQFEDIDAEWNNGLLVFGYYNTEIYNDLYGIYDVFAGKVLLEPVYDDIYMKPDGMIELDSYAKDPCKCTRKLISREELILGKHP